MRPISRKTFWWLTMALVLALTMSVASCSCGSKNKQPAPGPFGQGQGMAPGPGGPGGAMAKLMPKNIDEATKQKCAGVCKNMCVRGKECKSPGFAKPARCAKACLILCARGIVDEEISQCMTNASDCTAVNACLGGLATKIKTLRAGGAAAKPGTEPTTAPAPATAPAAPDAPAADGGK